MFFKREKAQNTQVDVLQAYKHKILYLIFKSLKNLKNHEFNFLVFCKRKNHGFNFFANFKKLTKCEFNCSCKVTTLITHEFHFSFIENITQHSIQCFAN
eukprot:UN22032